MEIKQLDPVEYKGREYTTEFRSDKYLFIEPRADGFEMKWTDSGTELKMSVKAPILPDWLDHPAAYGAFEDGRMLGFITGFLEKWNNRYRIADICVFDEADRRRGVGKALMETIMTEAVNSGARMAVLETQNFNYKAISFYRKCGFEIIGFDRYAYSNKGPEEHNMRIEMGIKLER